MRSHYREYVERLRAEILRGLVGAYAQSLAGGLPMRDPDQCDRCGAPVVGVGWNVVQRDGRRRKVLRLFQCTAPACRAMRQEGGRKDGARRTNRHRRKG